MKADIEKILQWPRGKLDFSEGCLIMGILNVTPDSFSDGGQFFDTEKAIAHGIEMASQEAAIIDIGGESSRPGSEPLSINEEITRVTPVIEALRDKIYIPISIDTYHVETAKAALDSGAAMINDITALSDQQMGELAAEYEVPIILMHMQGTPATMQKEPEYKDVVREVLEFLLERANRAEKAGVPKERIFIDPGIGFGKTLEHNLTLLRNLDKFVKSGYRVLVGTSRKSFIGKITGKSIPSDRLFGTAATVAHSASSGVSLVRVHDVPQMSDVVKIINALHRR
jgi:dihydropteroate synthase